MIKRTQNTFDGGMNKDLEPLKTPPNVMTDCVNGTFITFNGNEFTIQNDSGNVKVGSIDDLNNATGNSVQLSEGFIPVGIKEYGGILYVVSYNPISGDGEIGSFPSPETVITSDEDDTLGVANIRGSEFLKSTSCSFDANSSDNYTDNRTITKNLAGINQLPIMPGDQFAIYVTDVPRDSSDNCDDALDTFENTNGTYYDFEYIISKSDGSIEKIDSKDLVSKKSDPPKFIRYTGNTGGTISVVATVKTMSSFNATLSSVNNIDKSNADPSVRFSFDSDDESAFKMVGVKLDYSIKNKDSEVTKNYNLTLNSSLFPNAEMDGTIEGNNDEFKKGDLFTWSATPYSKYKSHTDLTKSGSFILNVNETPENANSIWRYTIDDNETSFSLGYDYDFTNNGHDFKALSIEFYDVWSDTSTYYNEATPILAPISSERRTANIVLVDEPISDIFDSNTRGGTLVSDLNGSDSKSNNNVSKYRKSSYVRSSTKLRKNHFYLVTVRLKGENISGDDVVYEINGSVYTNKSFGKPLVNDYHTLEYPYDNNFSFKVNDPSHYQLYTNNISPIIANSGRGVLSGKLSGLPNMIYKSDSESGGNENSVDSAGPGSGDSHVETVSTANNGYGFKWHLDFIHNGYGYTNQDTFGNINHATEGLSYPILANEKAYNKPKTGVSVTEKISSVIRTNKDKGHSVAYELSGDVSSSAGISGTSKTDTINVVKKGNKIMFGRSITSSEFPGFLKTYVNDMGSYKFDTIDDQDTSPKWSDQLALVRQIFSNDPDLTLPPLIGIITDTVKGTLDWFIKVKITSDAKPITADKRWMVTYRDRNDSSKYRYGYLISPKFNDFIYMPVDSSIAARLNEMNIYEEGSSNTVWPSYIPKSTIKYNSLKIVGDEESMKSHIQATKAIKTSAGTQVLSRNINSSKSIMKTYCHFGGSPELIPMDRTGLSERGYTFIGAITSKSKEKAGDLVVDNDHFYTQTRIDFDSTEGNAVASHYGMYTKDPITIPFNIVDNNGVEIAKTGYYNVLTPTQSYISEMLESEAKALTDSSLISDTGIGADYSGWKWPLSDDKTYNLFDNIHGLDKIKSASDLENVYLNDTLSTHVYEKDTVKSGYIQTTDSTVRHNRTTWRHTHNFTEFYKDHVLSPIGAYHKVYFDTADAIFIKHGKFTCPRCYFSDSVGVYDGSGATSYEPNINDSQKKITLKSINTLFSTGLDLTYDFLLKTIGGPDAGKNRYETSKQPVDTIISRYGTVRSTKKSSELKTETLRDGFFNVGDIIKP